MNRNSYISETTALNRKYEKKYYPKVRAIIQGQVNDVKAVVSAQGIQAGVNFASQIVSTQVGFVVQDIYTEVGLRYARRQWRMFIQQKRSAVKGFGFNADWVQWLKDFLQRFLIEKITFRVAETTRRVILNVLNKAIEQGWGVEKTVEALDELPLPRTQAATIVRTEIGRATNAGVMAAGSTFEYEQSKEWISADDMRVRGNYPKDHASHVLLNGTIIDEDELFVDPINGDRMICPHDPQASAASTVRCRCVVALVAKTDSRGRLIPKVKNKSFKMKPDYSEILKTFKEVKEELAVHIKNIPRPDHVDLDPVHRQLFLMNKRLRALEETSDDVSASVSVVGQKSETAIIGAIETITEATQKQIEASIGKADELMQVINSKEYSPEIKVDVNQQQIDDMRVELTAAINSLRVAIEQMKPVRNWNFKVNYDKDDRITTVNAVAIKV